MDPLSILSITNTALALAGRLGKTLSFLYHLSTKLRYADVKITLLVGYLGSLNVAIAEIADIVKGLSGSIQYQKLAESLSMTLDCTNLSLSFLETKLDGLRSKTQDGRSKAEKMTMIVRSSEFEEYVNGISCYVNALNLHLNSLQSRSLLEQQNILNSTDADSIIEAMRDETSSLCCLADMASVFSRRSIMSETSTAFDASFDFDAEILSSKIYGLAYRSHLKKAMTLDKRGASSKTHPVAIPKEDSGVSANPTLRPMSPPSNVDTEQSLGISEDSQSEAHRQTSHVNENLNTFITAAKVEGNSQMEAPRQTLPDVVTEQGNHSHANMYLNGNAQPDPQPASTVLGNTENPVVGPVPSLRAKVLLLGTSESGKSTILKGMKLHEEGSYAKDDRLSFLEIIYSNLTQNVRVVLEAMESMEIPLDTILDLNDMEYHVQTIFMLPSSMKSMPSEVHDAIHGLVCDGGFQTTLKQRREYQLKDNIDFYLQSLDRISSPEYLPSDEDILHSWVKTEGIKDTTLLVKEDSLINDRSMELVIFDVGGTRANRKKWIHAFENVDIIIFTVEIACYDQLLFEDETVNRLQEALTLFDSIVNSRWFVKTTIILCFTKRAKLVEKIKHSPFENYFPDFVPSNPPNPEKVMEYIVERFADLNQTNEPVRTIVLLDFLSHFEWLAIKRLVWEKARISDPEIKKDWPKKWDWKRSFHRFYKARKTTATS